MMKIKKNKIFPGNILLAGLSLFILAALPGCGVAPEAAPSAVAELTPIIEQLDLYERYAVVGIHRESFLEVHQAPSAASPIIGHIPSWGLEVLPTGEASYEGERTWVLISYQEISGWVDLDYLAEQHGSLPAEVILLGQQVLEALEAGQYLLLKPLIHPGSCLRFSPYSYLNDGNQLVCPPDLEEWINNGDPITWGHYDGTGDVIKLTLNQYHQRFVYDQDFIRPLVLGLNREVSSGNSINNIQEIYPDGIMVEYHFPGFDPQYGGMDWRSLRLVFLPAGGQWYLAAIIHGEWTI